MAAIRCTGASPGSGSNGDSSGASRGAQRSSPRLIQSKSYARATLLEGTLHWDLPVRRPVGQGGASDFQLVSFATEQATEEQRTVSKGYGGGLSFGIDVDVEVEGAAGALHGIVYAEETSFEATVGDIADPSDYEAWRYSWGFSVQTVGRDASADNEPTGYTGSKHGFQYLRYWAEPSGSAY